HDPRSTFYVPDDKKVIVYFEWEGATGQHQFEGLWKDPRGKVVAVADFEYEAVKERFAAYWELSLTEHMQTGWWTLEARVDGQSAGSHSFEVVSATKPDLPTRRVLTLDEIYQRALEASVFVEKLDGTGKVNGTALGFRLAPHGNVVTTFHAVDGAAGLRVIAREGPVNVDSVLAWDPRQNYAVLPLAPGNPSRTLAPAEPGSWKVGDRVLGLDVPAQGSRVIADGNITGKNTFPEVGERLNLSLYVRDEASGGPLLNEYGEVVAIAQTSLRLLPGSWSLTSNYGALPLSNMVLMGGAVALPLSALPNTLPRSPTSLSILAQRGILIPPLVHPEDVLMGRLARDVVKKHGILDSVDERAEFSRSEGAAQVVLTWNPRRKGKFMVTLRIYNLDSRLLFESKPSKISLSPNEVKYSSWKITFAQVPAGIYRAEVVLDNAPAWRTFFRITD
ncbi:MAG: S1 family peptidase, partial [Candidatus Acidiferrales bacterium]